MIFEKDGETIEVSEQAQIDCCIAKGWKEKKPENKKSNKDSK